MLSRRGWTLILAGVLTIAGAGVVSAQIKKGKTRPLTTAQLMKGIIKPHNEALKKALESAPADDEAWGALALSAGLLNEASYSLMDDGRCPDSVWADATTKNLRQASADLLKAIEGKNAEAAKTAAGAIGKSCKGCHDAHKKKAK